MELCATSSRVSAPRPDPEGFLHPCAFIRTYQSKGLFHHVCGAFSVRITHSPDWRVRLPSSNFRIDHKPPELVKCTHCPECTSGVRRAGIQPARRAIVSSVSEASTNLKRVGSGARRSSCSPAASDCRPGRTQSCASQSESHSTRPAGTSYLGSRAIKCTESALVIATTMTQ